MPCRGDASPRSAPGSARRARTGPRTGSATCLSSDFEWARIPRGRAEGPVAARSRNAPAARLTGPSRLRDPETHHVRGERVPRQNCVVDQSLEQRFIQSPLQRFELQPFQLIPLGVRVDRQNSTKARAKPQDCVIDGVCHFRNRLIQAVAVGRHPVRQLGSQLRCVEFEPALHAQ